MLRLQLLAGCVVVALMGTAHAAVFSVGHVNAIGKTGKLRFANVLADDVSGWEYRRGHYVVRETGYYFISFHGLSRHDDPLTLAVFKNDEELMAGYGSGTDYSTASNSGLVHLRYNDRISLRAVSGLPHESSAPSRNYFTLSGFRINIGGGPVPAGPSSTFAADLGMRASFPLPSAPPSAGAAGAEEADEFRPLTADMGGPV